MLRMDSFYQYITNGVAILIAIYIKIKSCSMARMLAEKGEEVFNSSFFEAPSL